MTQMNPFKIECEVPEGWVAVAEWNEHRGKGGAKGKYDALLTAINKRLIDYMSLGRPFRYYVRKEQAEAYLAEHGPKADVHETSQEIHGKIDRLTAVVQLLAEAIAGKAQ
jgi:hypothetical protein